MIDLDGLRREMRRERLMAMLHDTEWDVADAMAAVERWLGIPQQRTPQDCE